MEDKFCYGWEIPIARKTVAMMNQGIESFWHWFGVQT